MKRVNIEKVYDAYCRVCGHYRHTTPVHICRQACDYFKNFEALLNVVKEKEPPMSAEEVLVKAGLKPYKDGNQWCILAGDNIQEGICGFGDTIDKALYQFLIEVLERQKEQK